MRKFHVSYLVVAWSVGVIVWVGLGYVLGWLGGGFGEGIVGAEVSLSGVVMEDPGVSGSAMVLRLGNLESEGEAVEGTVYVQLGAMERIERSDRVEVVGVMSEGFGVFAGAMWRPRLKAVMKPDPPDAALGVRNWFGGLIRQYVPEPQASLAQGYLLGQKQALPEDFSDLLSEVGLTHMVVASGYNLSILAGVSRRIFGRVSRFAAMFFALVLLVVFVGITGLSASMMRASVVAGLGILAWYAGRKFHPAKLLLLVAAVTLLVNPMYIADLGWLLSFASFAGVMIVGPILTEYFYGGREPNFAAAVLLETMAAQLCCLPIILFFSGSFSLVSVAANILILPTIPAAMLLTFATGCLVFLPAMASVLGWLANLLLSFHIGVVEFFGDMKWAIVSVPAGNAAVLWGYLAIFLTVFYMKRRTKFGLMRGNMLELDVGNLKQDKKRWIIEKIRNSLTWAWISRRRLNRAKM